jgi:hypothetical protein
MVWASSHKRNTQREYRSNLMTTLLRTARGIHNNTNNSNSNSNSNNHNKKRNGLSSIIQKRNLSIGWPVTLVMTYVLFLVFFASKLPGDMSWMDGSNIANAIDVSFLPLLLGQKGRSSRGSNNITIDPKRRVLTNDWDSDREYWIEHIQQRQQYVKRILESVPMDVQNKPLVRHAEVTQCQERKKMYGANLTVLDEFQQNETTKHAIVIPFRDRDYHLQQFQKYMSDYLQHHYSQTNHTFTLYIIDQDDHEPFQRGFLMNAALDHVDHDVSCITMHDVDLVPIFFSPVPYHTCHRPIRLIQEMQTFDWKIPYDHYFGGIVNLHQQHWAVINGMGNQFRGWGAEDDELYQRLVYRALVNCQNANPATPADANHGVFMAISQDLEHHHARVKGKDYHRNCRLMDRHKWAGISNSILDGWSLNRYEVLSHEIQDTRDDPVLQGFAAIHTIRVVNRIQPLPPSLMNPHATTRG